MASKILMPLTLAALLACGVGGVYGYARWSDYRAVEATQNAYIRADIVAVAPKVPGYVIEVAVVDNQSVAKGDLLFRIDPADYEARRTQAVAGLAAARAARISLDAQTMLQGALINEADAGIRAAKAEAERALRDRARADNLVSGGWTSQQRHESAVAVESRARAGVQQAEAGFAARQQKLDVLTAEAGRLDAAIEQAMAQVDLAEMALSDTEVRAPAAGVIGNRHVDAGQYARPGAPLLSIVPLHDVWVVANFKETQLGRMAEGQRVTVQVDAFGNRVFHGRIDSMAPASGAEFSLLPPDNATGNFVRIVQRIPIKITLDPVQDASVQLRPGMSAEVRVQIGPGGMTSSKERLVDNGAAGLGLWPRQEWRARK